MSTTTVLTDLLLAADTAALTAFAVYGRRVLRKCAAASETRNAWEREAEAQLMAVSRQAQADILTAAMRQAPLQYVDPSESTETRGTDNHR